MITPGFAQSMAAYNAWQNASLYSAASTLTSAERQKDRGAFFGSIEATLAHIHWGDRAWLHRLAGKPAPAGRDLASSLRLDDGWEGLVAARRATDAEISDWVAGLSDADLSGDLSWYSASVGHQMTRPVWMLIAHLFNHQTHHRGQVHAMLTAAGARPEDTDLPLMPSLDGPS